jgi:hypothetical protein
MLTDMTWKTFDHPRPLPGSSPVVSKSQKVERRRVRQNRCQFILLARQNRCQFILLAQGWNLCNAESVSVHFVGARLELV